MLEEEQREEQPLTANVGDRVPEKPKSAEEKAEQVAVDNWDPAGHTTVPTYFVFEDKETGEKEALHHVRDADEISDEIRKARTDEEGNRTWW